MTAQRLPVRARHIQDGATKSNLEHLSLSRTRPSSSRRDAHEPGKNAGSVMAAVMAENREYSQF